MPISRRFTVLTFVVLSTVIMSGQQPPQEIQPPPVTFRLEINYVEVDAIVTDEQGNLVTNLTANDFEVLEDGKPQKISAFTMVNIPIERRDRPLFADSPIERDVQTNIPVEGRVYLIVLDGYHTDPLNALRVKAAARHFVERQMGANDIAAVVHTTGPSDFGQDFTTDRRLLRTSIDKFVGHAESATLSRLETFNRTRDVGTGDAVGVGPNGRGIYDPTQMEREFNSMRSLDTLKKLADFMAGIRGRRKAMVLISEGFPYDMADAFSTASRIYDEFRVAIGAASRSNVSIYTVDPKGLDTGMALGINIEGSAGPEVVGGDPNQYPTRPDERALGIGLESLRNESRLAQDSLRMLAEETGGVAAVNRNDFAAAFDRIVRDNSTYYLLGYYPSNDKRDGKFRRIELRVKRPGLRVRSRRGYVAPRGKSAEPKPASNAGSPALREAINSPLPMSGIPMAVFAAPFKGTPPNAAVMVSVELRAGDFKYTENNGAFTNTLDLSVSAVDASGKTAANQRSTAKLGFKPDTLARVRNEGFRVVTQIDLAPGRYRLRVAAAEQNGGTAGSVLYDLEVPDFRKSTLAMSGVVVMSASGRAVPTAGAQNVLGGALPAPATTRREFQPTDEIALFTEVYENAPNAAPHKVDITTTVRSDDGRVLMQNKEERDSTELQSGRGGYGYRVHIPLKDFAPGTYVIHVEARSRAGNDIGIGRDVQIRIK